MKVPARFSPPRGSRTIAPWKPRTESRTDPRAEASSTPPWTFSEAGIRPPSSLRPSTSPFRTATLDAAATGSKSKRSKRASQPLPYSRARGAWCRPFLRRSAWPRRQLAPNQPLRGFRTALAATVPTDTELCCRWAGDLCSEPGVLPRSVLRAIARKDLLPDPLRVCGGLPAACRARTVEAGGPLQPPGRGSGLLSAPEQHGDEARHVAEVRIELTHLRGGAPRFDRRGGRDLHGIGQPGAAQGEVRAQGILVGTRRGLEVDDVEDVGVEVAAEAAAAKLTNDASVHRIEHTRATGRIHERLHVLGDMNGAIEVEEFVQQHAAWAGLRFETHGEPASEELGLPEALGAPSTRRSALREGGEHPLLGNASRLRAERRVDGLERSIRLARREALEGHREEANPEQGAERSGRLEPGEAQVELPVRVGADRLVRERIHAHDAHLAPRGLEPGEEGPGAGRRLRVEIGEPQERLEPTRCLGAAACVGEGRAGRETSGDVVGVRARAAEYFVEIRRRARCRPGERGELGVGIGAPGIGFEGPIQMLASLLRAPLPAGHSRETEPRIHRVRLAREDPGEVILRTREVVAREGRAAETDVRLCRGGVRFERAREAILGGREIARLERLLPEPDERSGEIGPGDGRGGARRGAAGERDPRGEAWREERAPGLLEHARHRGTHRGTRVLAGRAHLPRVP